MPQWLSDAMEEARPDEAPQTDPAAPLDTAGGISRAVRYLTDEAPIAVYQASGDAQTLSVAMRVKDFGISQPMTLELMLEHWNERCSPPWPVDELSVKVRNAFKYGRNPPGSASPLADFGAAPAVDSVRHAEPVLPMLASAVPKRQWVISKLYPRRVVAIGVAPPGTGKSAFNILAALALATGRSDILGFDVPRRGRAWIWNQEDDKDELNRRLLAAMQHHDISWADLEWGGRPALYMNSGAVTPLLLSGRGGADGRKIIPVDADFVISEIRRLEIDLFGPDPLIEFHRGSENSNEDMAQVGATLRRIAVEGDCAMATTHHTRKPDAASSEGHAGNMDAARGASSLAGVARVMFTLESVAEADARRFGIAPDKRREYLRLNLSKGNMSSPDDMEQSWFYKRHSVTLGNALDGDSVGVLGFVPLGKPRPERDQLLASVVAVGKPNMPLPDLVRAVIASSTLYIAEDFVAMRRRVSRLLESMPEVDGWVYSLVENRKSKNEKWALKMSVA